MGQLYGISYVDASLLTIVRMNVARQVSKTIYSTLHMDAIDWMDILRELSLSFMLEYSLFLKHFLVVCTQLVPRKSELL